MALTAKPISTISYNTGAFLDRKLTELFKAHIINDYRYIFHYGEDGDKDHYHIYIEPNKRLDTGKLREEFNEIQTNENKPLGCMPFRSSKGDHWIMYVLHDPKYLIAHNSQDDGDGKIVYQLENIGTPFREQLQRDYKVALRLQSTDNQKIYESMAEGKPLTQIAYEQDINPMKILAIQHLYQYDTHQTEINEILKERVRQMDIELAQKDENLKNLTEEMRMRELEYKTGMDLRNQDRESVFDEDIKK